MLFFLHLLILLSQFLHLSHVPLIALCYFLPENYVCVYFTFPLFPSSVFPHCLSPKMASDLFLLLINFVPLIFYITTKIILEHLSHFPILLNVNKLTNFPSQYFRTSITCPYIVSINFEMNLLLQQKVTGISP